MHPSSGIVLSKCSRCGASRIFKLAGEPSAGIVRVETLSLWRRENSQACSRTLSLFSARGSAGAWSVLGIQFGIDSPRCFGRVAALARGAYSASKFLVSFFCAVKC